MNVITDNPSGVEIQQGFFESLIGLLMISPVFIIGIIVIGILLALIFGRSSDIPKGRISVLSVILYYYLSLMFTNIVGIPALREWIRLIKLGENVFNPNLNFSPLISGNEVNFVLNIILFIPLGFLCPFISRAYEQAKNMLILGLGLSIFIEISQLFTQYRATDIDDLLTNTAGTMIGYLCFRVLAVLRFKRMTKAEKQEKLLRNPEQMKCTAYLPPMIATTAFVTGFFR